MAPLNPFAPQFLSPSTPLITCYPVPQLPHQIINLPPPTTAANNSYTSNYADLYCNPNPNPFPVPVPVPVPTPTYYIYNVQPNYVMYYRFFNKDQSSWPAAEPTEAAVAIEEPEAAEEENLIRREEEYHTGSSSSSSIHFNKRRSFRKKWKAQFQKTMDFEFRDGDVDVGSEQPTTVMIKNVPSKFDKQKVLDILDDHCRRVNEKAKAEADALSAFDFLYLPIDFKTGCNLGYAFVNFTTPMAAIRLYRELHHISWAPYGSRKVCEITYARIQGLPKLLAHFSNSKFYCEREEYLPVHFSSGRGDSSLVTGQRYIGRHFPNWI